MLCLFFRFHFPTSQSGITNNLFEMVEDEKRIFIAQQGYLPPPASCSPFPSIPALAGATTTQAELWSPERGGGTMVTSAWWSAGSLRHADASLLLLAQGRNLETATHGACGEYFQGLENGRGTRTTSRWSQLRAQRGFGS